MSKYLAMADPISELSSVDTALGDLTMRIGGLAKDLEQNPASANTAAELYEVEHSLISAQRRLGKLLRRS